MGFHHFKALMWKNFRLKLYHWIVIIFELLFPIGVVVAFLVFVFILANSLGAKNLHRKVKDNISVLDDEDDDERVFEICFTPESPATSKFMEKLRNNNGSFTVKLTPVANETVLENYMSAHEKHLFIGVQFLNVKPDASSLPNKFSYALRASVNYLDANSPHNKSIFALVQMLLNRNFIQHKTNSEKFSPHLLPFPEPVLYVDPTLTLLTFCLYVVIGIFSIPLMWDILEEKNSGVKWFKTPLAWTIGSDTFFFNVIQELIKITGANEWMIWLCWLIYAISVISISITVASCLATMYPIPGNKHLMNYVPLPILWLFLVLYSAANAAFCFTLASIFQTATPAVVLYMIYFIAITFTERHITLFSPYISALIPACCFLIGRNEMFYYEVKKREFSLTVFTHPQNKEYNTSLAFIFAMLVLDILLYVFLAYYITNIYPGAFGVAKSPFFLFETFFPKDENLESSSAEDTSEIDPKYFETPPSNLNVILRIVDLQKYFNNLHVVRGVNLNTYQGEITALLGHNGAGKTTTMSILTGLLSPSSGEAYYRDMNIFENMDEFRLNVGLCPQENRTIPYLSVIDHLTFFGQLKGFPKSESREEAQTYIDMMNLTNHSSSRVHELSGGMKRKLCLSVAMMGKAEVLILDEPTSGLDAESRRSLWDLLLDLRGDRTMILSTHYMDEADALGDRIAIMNHGIIVCYGTSMFLKKAYETGYELTITKTGDTADAISRVIQSTIPYSSLISDTRSQVVYKLPLTETHRFSRMFRSLESAGMQLGIENVGLSATTLENVFLKAGGATTYDPTVPKDIVSFAQYDKKTGVSLFFQQMWAVFKKKFLFSIRDKTSIFFRIVLVTALLAFILPEEKFSNSLPDEIVNISLSTHPGSIVMYQEINVTDSMTKYAEEVVTEKQGKFIKTNDTSMVEILAAIEDENPVEYKTKYLSAISALKSGTILRFSTRLSFGLPITIDLFSNILLRSLTKSDEYSIETISHSVPAKRFNFKVGCFPLENNQMIVMAWFIVLGFFTTDLLTYFSPFVSMEQVGGFYHVQMMSSMFPFAYWLATFIFDFAFFSFSMAVRLIILKIMSGSGFIGFNEAFSSVLFLTLGFVAAFTPLLFYPMLAIFILFIPLYIYYRAIVVVMDAYYINSQCSYCEESYRAVCEENTAKVELLIFTLGPGGEHAVLLYMAVILIQIVLYSSMLYFLWSGFFGYILDRLQTSILQSDSTDIDLGDDDVQRERDLIQQLRQDDSSVENISLIADGLHKKYKRSMKLVTAVSDVSMLVEPGTCFGLLGVNGAGKSTTFKMLTAEVVATAGDASIDGVKLSENRSEYVSLGGYCPQTDSFIEQLTAVEMLNLIALMRGIQSRDSKEVVDSWISIAGLEEYKNRRCGTYSGGNKRKLCLAMSLVGDPRVVFLDEPTSGVDPVARRNLYDVMEQSRASGQTVILTSHSMEECEAVCDRLTIMVSGVMKCIGSVQHLKRRYAQGFSLLLRIIDSPEAVERLPELKDQIINVFDPYYTTLKDEHVGLLYFQLTNTSLLWSVMFERMEAIKADYQDVVEDYVLTDSTLEEVFISFAKSSLVENGDVSQITESELDPDEEEMV